MAAPRALLTSLVLLAALGLAAPAASAAGGSTSTLASAATSTPVCSGPAQTKPDGTAWVCTFDDEFSGTSLDPSKWVPVTSASSGLIAGGSGSSMGCYVDTPDTISVSGGTLKLTARKESSALSCPRLGGTFRTRYVTGQVASAGRFSQTYGLFSVRAKFPAATVAGLQSALWMWPQDLASTGLHGEIDIAEEYSQLADRAVPTLHYSFGPTPAGAPADTNDYTNYDCMISDVSAFHEYTLEWTPTTMTIRYDGTTCLVDQLAPDGPSPFDQPYFLALTQALGIGSNVFSPTKTPLPATTQVDWVRAWK